MAESQQPWEPREEDQVGDRFTSDILRWEVLKILCFILLAMESLWKAARANFFNPFFPSFTQFRLQRAIPHSASGHITWNTPEILPITADYFLIPPATGFRRPGSCRTWRRCGLRPLATGAVPGPQM